MIRVFPKSPNASKLQTIRFELLTLSYALDGTYNSETEEFEWTKSYYRTLVYKLSFALVGIILIFIVYELIKYLIPDAPRYLVERKQQTESILREKRKHKMKVIHL